MKTQTRSILGKVMLMGTVMSSTLFMSCNHEIANKPEDAVGTVYTTVDVMPKFNGDLTDYLSKNITYPATARMNGTTGTVYINFIVTETGDVINAKIIKGDDAELKAEALRVISAMPKWVPGQNNGKPVSVSFNLPIHFELK